MMLLLIIGLIVVHMIDGRAVILNPQQITSLSEARSAENKAKQLHPDVRCVVYLTDGRFVSVAEDCNTVKGLIEGEKQ